MGVALQRSLMRPITFVVVLGVLAASSDAFANAYVNNAYVNNAYVNNAYVNNAYVNNAYVNNAYVNSGPLTGTRMPGMIKYSTGATVQYPWLDGSQLTGWTYETGSWVFHSGEYFEGILMQATTKSPTSADERALWLWIADAVGASTNTGDVWAYLVLAYIPQDDGSYNWMPLCGYDQAQNPIYAMPLNGEWDYTSGTVYGGRKMSSTGDTVTFACLDAALGKCAASGFANTMGYRPWEGHWRCVADETGTCVYTYVPGEDVHQACTRMVRADYCGDGTAHTLNGTFIDVYDQLQPSVNVSSSTPPAGYSSMEFEALWGPDGATRISCVRWDVLGFSATSACPTYVDPADPTMSPFTHEMMRQCTIGGWAFYDHESFDSLVGNANTNIYSTVFSSAPRSIHLPPL
jgi:hypothetical protein